LEANSNEINLLIKAYNGMVDELEKSAIKLASENLARNGENKWHTKSRIRLRQCA
jgi:hypothetical protein